MSRQEATQQYMKALKQGRKTYKDCVLHGRYPYPQILDDILDDAMVAGRVDLGVVEIPTGQIVGTRTLGRRSAFAADFMPLLDANTEFAMKWVSLCAAHLGDEGIREPIRCYEYLGRFYVQEGNKRVSVLKSFGAPTISSYVIRVVPQWSEDPEVRAYYDFLEAYRHTSLYQVRFTRPGSFEKLQAALGYDPGHDWTQDERRKFLAGLAWFTEAFEKAGGKALPITPADALLVWLKVYLFDQLMGAKAELQKTVQVLWPDIKGLAEPEPITVTTEEQADEAPGAGLRKFYPYYTQDMIVSVPDEVAQLLQELTREDDARRIRTYRHKAVYSLELLSEIREFPSDEPLPEDILEQSSTRELLYKGLESLPEKQRSRLIAYYFLGMNKVEIAHSEGCNPAAIVRSIQHGEEALKKFFKKFG